VAHLPRRAARRSRHVRPGRGARRRSADFAAVVRGCSRAVECFADDAAWHASPGMADHVARARGTGDPLCARTTSLRDVAGARAHARRAGDTRSRKTGREAPRTRGPNGLPSARRRTGLRLFPVAALFSEGATGVLRGGIGDGHILPPCVQRRARARATTRPSAGRASPVALAGRVADLDARGAARTGAVGLLARCACPRRRRVWSPRVSCA